MALADRANISDIEALEEFRAVLVLFSERLGAVINEVSEEVKRTRIWLETEQKMALQQAMKRHQRDMQQLEAEMFTARLSKLKQAKTGQQMLINSKRRHMRELEETMRKLAGWQRNFDTVVEIEARKVDKLRHFIDIDMKKANTFLTESVKQLSAYASGE